MAKKNKSEESKADAPKPGRPSKYKPEYCQQLIAHMTTGLSFDSFAAVIDVNQDTLHEWVKVHPDFSEAKKEAYSKNLLFWENHGIEGLYSTTEYDDKGKPTSSKSINATVWIFNMKNRHKWRDKQPDEVDTIVNNNIGSMSDKDLDTKIDEKLKKLTEGKSDGT